MAENLLYVLLWELGHGIFFRDLKYWNKRQYFIFYAFWQLYFNICASAKWAISQHYCKYRIEKFWPMRCIQYFIRIIAKTNAVWYCMLKLILHYKSLYIINTLCGCLQWLLVGRMLVVWFLLQCACACVRRMYVIGFYW